MAGIRDIANTIAAPYDVVAGVFETIFRMCRDSEEVRIKGFGTFLKKTTPARQIRSPLINDGEPVDVGPSYRIQFRPSQQARRRLNAKKKKKTEAAQPAPKKKGKKKA